MSRYGSSESASQSGRETFEDRYERIVRSGVYRIAVTIVFLLVFVLVVFAFVDDIQSGLTAGDEAFFVQERSLTVPSAGKAAAPGSGNAPATPQPGRTPVPLK